MQAPHYLFLEQESWAILFWGSTAFMFFFSGWVNSRERNMASGDMRDRGSRVLIYVLSPLGAISAFVAPFIFPAARIGLPPAPVFYTAMGLFWLGLFFYVWAVATLGAYFRTTVQILDGHRLITNGPYRFLRHPVYTGGTLVFSGMGLAIGNWVSFAVAALTTLLAYVWRIHVEEIALGERFGAEFAAHRKRTWAVIPFLW
jgi:protein-S-isoprenylcysteine O-methyltransferase Ste14